MTANDLARSEAVIGILMDWADWMKGYDSKGGYPKRSAGFSMATVVGTFEDMCDHADAHRNQVVDSCIDDLPPNQKAAIYRCYLWAVFRMPDYEGSLIAAHLALEIELKKKGMVW